MKLKLYHYWRSSSSWRVRWALAEKNITCEFVHVNLLKDEQKSQEHLKKNPIGFVPALEVINANQTKFLAESVAIIEWLEENYSDPKLLPEDSFDRAQTRQLVQIINAGTQPLQNLQTQKHFSEDTDKKKEWAQYWIKNGLAAYEKLASQTAGKFSFDDTITMADMFLLPQLYNAERFSVSLEAFPTIQKIQKNCVETEGYKASHPDRFKP